MCDFNKIKYYNMAKYNILQMIIMYTMVSYFLFSQCEALVYYELDQMERRAKDSDMQNNNIPLQILNQERKNIQEILNKAEWEPVSPLVIDTIYLNGAFEFIR